MVTRKRKGGSVEHLKPIASKRADGAKEIFNKEGKIIGYKLETPEKEEEVVQYLRTHDGQTLKVRGLRPGQRLVQVLPSTIQSQLLQHPPPVVNNRDVIGIQSLGDIKVTTSRENKIIVHGPDFHASIYIAKLLASGDAKLGTVNGQQILLILGGERTTASDLAITSIIYPEVSSITDSENTSSRDSGMQSMKVQPMTSIISPDVSSITAQPMTSIIPPGFSSITGQPVTSNIAPPPPNSGSTIEVTARLVQTKQGPRIILQGLAGVTLEQELLAQIQEAVQTELFIQQVLARVKGKIPPSQVNLTVTRNFTKAEQRFQRITVNLPQSVIKQGQFTIEDGRKVLVLPRNILTAYLQREELLQNAQNEVFKQEDPLEVIQEVQDVEDHREDRYFVDDDDRLDPDYHPPTEYDSECSSDEGYHGQRRMKRQKSLKMKSCESYC